MVAFHRTLPEESVVYRYFHMMSLQHRTTHERLVRIGRDEHIERVTAEILHGNGAMQRLCRKLGFQLRNAPEVVEAWVDLAGWQPPLEAGGQPSPAA